jgi:hypothetical protein
VTVVDSEAGGVCPSGTASLNWNQTGLQGSTGPQGPAGPALSPTITTVGIEDVIPVANNYWFATADCPTGTVAISGGFKMENAQPPVEAKVVLATPTLTLGTTVQDPHSYSVAVQIDVPPVETSIKIQVFAICVDWSS